MKPSQHFANCSARIAELGPDTHAAHYRELAITFASLADAENRERIREQKECETAAHAIGVLETAYPEKLSAGQLMMLADILLGFLVEVSPAWAEIGHMRNTSRQLRDALESAEHKSAHTYNPKAEYPWQRMAREVA